jgi:hypothetical protein
MKTAISMFSGFPPLKREGNIIYFPGAWQGEPPEPPNAPDVVETLELLLRLTEKNGRDIALIYPGESADFVRGYVAGQIDALRLALDHVRDTAARR